nr:hypothetical protein [Tanacetum cinerariifolium]
MEHLNTTPAKIPILDTGKFKQWQFRIQQYLQHKHYALWEVIEFRDSYESPDDVVATGSAIKGTGKKKGRAVALTTKDMQKRKNDVKARTTLLLALPDEHQLRFKIEQDDLNQKFLTSLAPEWLMHTIVWRNRSDLDTMSLDYLYNRLKVYESEVQKKSKSDSHNMAFTSSAKNSSGKEHVNTASVPTASTNVSPASVNIGAAPKALMEIDEVGWDWSFMENEEEDHTLVVDEETHTEFALMAKTSADSEVESRLVEFKNQEVKYCKKIRGLEFKVKARANRTECLTNELKLLKKEKEGLESKLTGFQSASKDLDRLLESQRLDKNKEGKPSPAIESTSDDVQNRNPFVPETKSSPSTISSKPFIKFVKAVDPPTVAKSNKRKMLGSLLSNMPNYIENLQIGLMLGGNSQINIDDKGYWDSGCSWHMTSNISYLTNYEPYDEGYVSFGQDGCKITGKGTIKTGKLEFENVYFVKDLKYNLFSVSQICDNKNSVLFTDSRCIVLGRNFKLTDDANVLLRTPRQHNMYTINLNNIVPHKDLTCLVAKASADECMLWHRRLGHLNFKTMNRLVRHNLVRGLPFKCFDNDHTCVDCLKGKQHKASCKTKLVNSVTKPLHTLHMDLFGPTSVSSLNHRWYCLVVTDDFSRFTWTFFLKTKDETSGILRNFITEIENLKELRVKFIRTLIEAARTMLADAKLFVTFLAEAVNTACYVQNRVLVNKSQNKTPYELFNGRFPTIGFLKPFGCHVMILNTLENLRKFEAKRDEGYFLGYSMSSKAFRVFNKRTKRVEENFHVDFLENKPIEKGVGPNWLFDIDSLTNSMNYVLVVVAGTNSTNFLGTKEAAGQDVKKDASSLRYIVLPNWFHEAHLESFTSNTQDTCSADAPECKPKKISDALQDPSWVEAMQEELLQFKIQNVWSLVDCPKGDPEFPIRVYKVEKAMYGLHQAPKAWHRGDFILVQVYVDDIIFGSSNPQLCREFEALMHEKFQMSAMGELNFFLGLQVLQKKDGIFLSQDKYVGDILKKFGYSDVRSVNTPMDKENPWGRDGTGKDVDLHHYRSMIGSLMYLTTSRPNIMFAVCAYTIVATSTTEVEYVAAASCCGQVLWIQNQLLDYGVDHIHTDENVADLLTKPFDAGRFQYLVNTDFHPIVDFVRASHIRYALTFNPTVYVFHIRQIWSNARIETTKERTKILATVDGKLGTISESSIRRNLKLNDECLSPKSIGFNEFSSNITTALVCLATNRVYNFSKMIFDGMVRNVNNKVSKILMYPRFLSKCLKMGQFGQITHTHTYVVPFHTRKIFSTLRVNSPSFSGRIVPLFPSMLVTMGEGSGTPTEPHHTPTPEATPSPQHELSSSSLPPVTAESLPTVIPSDNPPLKQYTRRTRIAQSLVLPPVADEPVSPLGDDSQGEACPTDFGFGADQDRASIAKTSTLPSDSTPRVTSLAADEGSMQQKLDELTALCTSLQRQQSEMVSKFEAQELEITNLKANVKLLEDREGGGITQSRDDAPIKGRSLDEGEETTKRVSDDTKKIATVLTSMDAASILTSEGVQVVPTAAEVATAIVSIPTDNGVVSTASPTIPTAALIFTTTTESTTYTRRKGKETMVESKTPKKKKVQEQIDVQLARELEEEMARDT